MSRLSLQKLSMAQKLLTRMHVCKLSNSPTKVSGEEEVYDRIGSRVERSQTLYESRNGNGCLTHGNKTVDLQEIPNKVWTPT